MGLFVLSSGCSSVQRGPTLPEVEDIVRIEIFYQDDIQVKQVVDTQEIKEIIDNLEKDSTLTKTESINDQPTNIKDYYVIAFIFDKNEGSSRAYIYGSKGKYYFEQPYQGIWEVSEKTFYKITQ